MVVAGGCGFGDAGGGADVFPLLHENNSKQKIAAPII
jgi:hypothetical protein